MSSGQASSSQAGPSLPPRSTEQDPEQRPSKRRRSSSPRSGASALADENVARSPPHRAFGSGPPRSIADLLHPSSPSGSAPAAGQISPSTGLDQGSDADDLDDSDDSDDEEMEGGHTIAQRGLFGGDW